MALLTEALSVIIKVSSLQNKYLGGIKEFLNTIPNSTYCTDGLVHRVGFMTPQDVGDFIQNLEQYGLIFVYDNECIDIAVVDMMKGPTGKCDWLGFERQKFFSEQKHFKHSEDYFSIVWLITEKGVNGIPLDDEGVFKIVVPPDWSPDNALYGHNFIPFDKIKDQFIELGIEKGVTKFWYSKTGEIVYVGSPKIKFTYNSNKN